ncbi:DNA repair protein RecO [Citricoccus sp. SGAir0253]|uniref:DNA repair protein RecO n=1 Tax=Citricoccus sp. SGAir0253 TaxID=2567881 RepID=UPI0010CCDC97|nr:DNA repair protein RecO [Citricoccus sp. SGAir0253]QCU78014.1 DNA repair protein RecO [Citricoccus sp. SGAir0253]
MASRGGGYAANSYRTDALVLRTYKLGEADRIIVLLTPGHGQVRAVAKGVRRTTSRFGATLEPFMLSRLQLVHGRSLDIVTQAQSVTPYGEAIAADYDAYAAASAMVETAERLTAAEVGEHGGGVEAPSQYRLLHGALAALARHAHPPRLVLDSYLLRALATAGWAPSFTDCARCGAPGPHRSVNVTLGGSVCDDCRPPGSATPAPGTIALLAALLSGDWAVADAAPEQARREAAGIVAGYLQFHLERHLKSLSVMDQNP